MEKLYTVSQNKTGSCGSDHGLLIAKFRLKLKKVGKTTRPFRYDLNQIPYNYTVDVTNTFKGLNLIECLKNYGWRFVILYRRLWSKPSPRKRKARRQSGCLRRPYKNSWETKRNESQSRKGKISQLNAEFQRTAKRDKKALLSDQCKEIEENNRMGKTRDLFKKIRDQGNISWRDGHNKGQKWYGPNRSIRD